MQLTTQDALAVWHRSIAASVRNEGPDLSARQMALLLTVYMSEPPHTVRGLAAGLRISKPAVVRALDTLRRHGFVRRRRDAGDRRNVLVQRTVEGSRFLTDFAAYVIESAGSL